MRTRGKAGIAGTCAVATGLWAAGAVRAQQADAPDAPKVKADDPGAEKPESIRAIDAEFARELARLERRRLDRLARLAAEQTPAEAAATYETYFRLAIAGGLYREAEPVAERVSRSRDIPARVAFLAEVVNVLAEADRGAYEDSIRTLVAAVRDSDLAKAEDGATARPPLPVGTRLTILEAYFQRLVRGEQFEIAGRALRLVRDHSSEAAVKDFLDARLKRLDLVGRPSPPIAGNDVDNRPFRLSDDRGNPVLVVFWASWCLPCAEEVSRIERVYGAYRDRGLRVVGINLDPLQDGGKGAAEVLPNVRRFLIDHNVPWPNLLNGTGEQDFAAAYAVTELPANVLIGRDGKVSHLDLTRANLEKVVAKAVEK